MKNTRIPALLLLLGTTIMSHAQDVITKKDGTTVAAKIETVDFDRVLYKPFDNQTGPFYSLSKADVTEIRWQNGKTQVIESQQEHDLETIPGIQKFLSSTLNQYGYKTNSVKRRLNVSFEGNYMRIASLDKNGQPENQGLLFDFSKVYVFRDVQRKGDWGYFEVFADFLKRPKSNKWDKNKAEFWLETPAHAEAVWRALQEYHKLLTNGVKTS